MSEEKVSVTTHWMGAWERNVHIACGRSEVSFLNTFQFICRKAFCVTTPKRTSGRWEDNIMMIIKSVDFKALYCVGMI